MLGVLLWRGLTILRFNCGVGRWIGYVYREEMFPSVVFRCACDAIRAAHQGTQGDLGDVGEARRAVDPPLSWWYAR